MDLWSGVWEVTNFVGKVARGAAVGAATDWADVVAKGYAISQLAKESWIRIFKKGEFVARALDVVGDNFMGEYATP